MSERRDLRELIDGDLSPEELERLERIDELLRTVPAPPAAVPRSLSRAVAAIPATPARLWTRRRLAGAVAIAAAVAAFFFGLGRWVGDGEAEYRFEVAMQATDDAPKATARIRVGERDPETGNYRLEVEISGLPKLAGNGYYDLWLAKNGKYAAGCGTFNVGPGTTTVEFTVSYRLGEFDTWVISQGRLEKPPHLLTAPVEKA